MFKGRLDVLFRYEEDDLPVWETGMKGILPHHPYYEQINQLIDQYLKNPHCTLLYKKWTSNHNDTEIINNYQRFHLFPEVFKDKTVPHDMKLQFMKSWIDAHPLRINISWNSFNCALRLINWLKILWSIPSTAYPSKNDWRNIQFGMYLQTLQICKNIEYHIPGNHVFIQLFSIWLMSRLFPEWQSSHRILKSSEQKVLTEIKNQFLKSGFHFEQSYHYHVQITLLCLYWLYGMRRTGRTVNASFENILCKAFVLVKQFILPDGSLPMLGDHCFPFFHEHLGEDVDNTLALGEYLFPSTNRKKSDSDSLDVHNQYIVCSNEASKLIVDVGNIGLKNNPGHGHSDILSFIYCSKGLPIFIDPGIRKYSNNADDVLLKKAISHNTLSIDQEDQAKLWGFFRWGFMPKDVNYNMETIKNTVIIRSKYYGFQNIGGFTHHRVISMEQESLDIEDHVEGHGIHTLFLNLILSPQVNVEPAQGHLRLLNTNHSWNVNIQSEVTPEVMFVPFFCYMNYNMPTPIKKIEYIFKDVKLPFHSKLSVTAMK